MKRILIIFSLLISILSKGQDNYEGFVVNNKNDTTVCYFKYNFKNPKKKEKVGVGSSWITYFDPQLDKIISKYVDELKYYEYFRDGLRVQYYRVPVPSIGKKTLPYFGKLMVDGKYKLLQVKYGSGGPATVSRFMYSNPTSYGSFKASEYTYYYLMDDKNQFVMVRRIVKNRSKKKFVIDCPIINDRFDKKYYKKRDLYKLIADLNEFCINKPL